MSSESSPRPSSSASSRCLLFRRHHHSPKIVAMTTTATTMIVTETAMTVVLALSVLLPEYRMTRSLGLTCCFPCLPLQTRSRRVRVDWKILRSSRWKWRVMCSSIAQWCPGPQLKRSQRLRGQTIEWGRMRWRKRRKWRKWLERKRVLLKSLLNCWKEAGAVEARTRMTVEEVKVRRRMMIMMLAGVGPSK